jgi:hypothetical protein
MAAILERLKKTLGDKPIEALEAEISTLRRERSAFARDHDSRQKGLPGRFLEELRQNAKVAFIAAVAQVPYLPTDPDHEFVRRLALLATVAGEGFDELAKEAIAKVEAGWELTTEEYAAKLAEIDREIAKREAEITRRRAEELRERAAAEAAALEAQALGRLNGGA